MAADVDREKCEIVQVPRLASTKARPDDLQGRFGGLGFREVGERRDAPRITAGLHQGRGERQELLAAGLYCVRAGGKPNLLVERIVAAEMREIGLCVVPQRGWKGRPRERVATPA